MESEVSTLLNRAEELCTQLTSQSMPAKAVTQLMTLYRAGPYNGLLAMQEDMQVTEVHSISGWRKQGARPIIGRDGFGGVMPIYRQGKPGRPVQAVLQPVKLFTQLDLDEVPKGEQPMSYEDMRQLIVKAYPEEAQRRKLVMVTAGQLPEESLRVLTMSLLSAVLGLPTPVEEGVTPRVLWKALWIAMQSLQAMARTAQKLYAPRELAVVIANAVAVSKRKSRKKRKAN